MTYEEDVQFALNELQKEKKLKRKEARKIKMKKIKESASKYATKKFKTIGKRILKAPIKPGAGYKFARQLSSKIEKAGKGKKVSSAELKARRRHEIKMAKLRHKQRMQYLKAQQEAVAREQDMRYQPDLEEEQFLAGAEPDRMDEYENPEGEYPFNQPRRNFFDFLRGIGNLSPYRQNIQVTAHLPPDLRREINRRQNILNAEKWQGNSLLKPAVQRLYLTKSQNTTRVNRMKAPRLRFWRA